jgi:hypothetical protein
MNACALGPASDVTVNAIDSLSLGDAVRRHGSEIVNPTEQRGTLQPVVGRGRPVGRTSANSASEGVHSDNERNDVGTRR